MCGAPLQGGAKFCAQCGSTVSPITPATPVAPVYPGYTSPPTSGPITPPSSSQSRTVVTVVIVIVVLLVIVVALAIIPFPHGYSYTLSSSALNNGVATLSVPAGSQVTGSWSTSSGGSITLTITDELGNTVYSADAASGSFSFTGSNSPYTFTASSLLSEDTSISGSYASPLI